MADLRVTDSNDIRRGYPFAALKNVILNKGLLVAYAGNATVAMHTLRTLEPDGEVNNILSVLLTSAEEAGAGSSGVDYLVAVAGQRLWRITHTGIEQEAEATGIGDHQAFEIYQRAYHEIPVSEPLQVEGLSPPGPPPYSLEELEPTLRMMNGIWALQFGPSVESVGEAFISAVSLPEGFHYEPQAYLAADHEQVIDSGEWTPADWGTVAEGGFGYSILSPTELGIGVLALYFPHPGLGLLYHPLKQDDAFAYPRVTQDEFGAHVFADHGLRISGPGFGPAAGSSPAP